MTELSETRVYKFGGISLADSKSIEMVRNIVLDRKYPKVVVLSAMHGVTDLLLTAAQAAVKGEDHEDAARVFREKHERVIDHFIQDPSEKSRLKKIVETAVFEFSSICTSLRTLKEHTRRALDRTAARGERVIAQIFTSVLNAYCAKATFVDALDVVELEKQFGSLLPNLEKCKENAVERVRPLLQSGFIVIIPGYIGKGPDGDLVTLGRGGTDLSATVLGHSLRAKSVVLFKEVQGLLTADPRYVTEARVVPELHYREAAELAYYGAKVLHPSTIIPLLPHEIPLLIKSTYSPHQAGTRIAADVDPGAFPVKALTANLGQALFSIEGKGMMGVPGIAGRAFQALAQNGTSVSMISQASSEASICFVVPDDQAKSAEEVLRDAFHFEIEHRLIDTIKVSTNQAVIAVVGLGMRGTHGIAARTFQALARGETNIEAIAQGSSELNISVAIAAEDVPRALRSLHREYRLEKIHALSWRDAGEVSVSIFGFGQIGRAFLMQALAQRKYFQEKMHISFRCIGLADRSGLVVDDRGFEDDELRAFHCTKANRRPLVAHQSSELTITTWIKKLKAELWSRAVNRGVFVDLTAEETAPLIKVALQEGYHVVVANKKPLAIGQDEFDALFATARSHNVALRYEATVGAGLPILDTLAKLREAGDEIDTILGCLSGTLGFLMTEVGAGTRFSRAVQKAHTLGFTEPDPREDLSGMDVARKALILARTLGRKLNLDELLVEPLFRDEHSADDPEVFIENLSELDEYWAERVAKAKSDDNELRYVARIDADRVSVGIEAVPAASPLGRLSGTDNQVSIKTKLYSDNLLVVTGPGAGADVTAAGVLNDVLAIASAQERLSPI